MSQAIVRSDGEKSIAAPVTRREMEKAITGLLPNGRNLSTEQAQALVTVALHSGRDPFMREVYATDIGLLDAHKGRNADFNRWLDARGDSVEAWDEERIPHTGAENIARRAELGANDARDEVVHVRLFLRSGRQAWIERGNAMRGWGATYQDIAREVGTKPPPVAEAFGVVMFDEQRKWKGSGSDKRRMTDEETAAAWRDMDMKFSRFERTSKRARDLIIAKYLPTTTEIRKAHQQEWVTQMSAAVQDPTKFIASDGVVIERPTGETADDVARRLGRQHADDSLLDNNPARVAAVIDQHQTRPIVEGTATMAPAGPDWEKVRGQDPLDDSDDQLDAIGAQVAAETTAEHAQEFEDDQLEMPTRFESMRGLVAEKAGFLEAKDWRPSEKQGGFINSQMRTLCKRDDVLYRAVLWTLTGHTHWGDATPFQQLAILRAWLNEYNRATKTEQPRQMRAGDVEEIAGWLASLNPTQRAKFEE